MGIRRVPTLQSALLVVCMCTSCLLGAQGANADSPLVRRTAVIYLPRSKGFSVTLVARANGLDVDVANFASETIYSSGGGLVADSIRGKLGRIGSVALDFRPTGNASLQNPPSGCKGEPAEVQAGHFVGSVHLRGERRFFELHVKAASGLIRDAHWDCTALKQREAKRRDQLRPGVLAVFASSAGGLRFFGALSRNCGSNGLSTFVAGIRENRGDLKVMRKAIALAGPGACRQTDEGIMLRPPEPFKGTAVATLDPASWLGSLHVLLPGRGSVRLTEPRLHVLRVNKHSLSRFFQVLLPS